MYVSHWVARAHHVVYGYTVLIGSVIGCVAGVTTTNGYASEHSNIDVS